MPKRSPSSRSADDINKRFGARLREFREGAGRSQSDVGRSLAVSFQQVQKYENGTTSISLDRLSQLADFFTVPIGNLIGPTELGRPPGFADGEQATFDVEPGSPLTAHLSRESQALLKAFHRIRSRKLRRSILAIVEAYEGRGEPDDDDTED